MTMNLEHTSRIVVKNVPKYVNQNRLKSHFSSQGQTITDVKIVTTKDGKSRRFAYIGFKTDEEGLNAVKYYNNTYLDTCKLMVEVAKTIGDETLSRPWSKYSKGSSAYVANNTSETELTKEQQDFLKELGPEAEPEDKEDPQLKEFLAVMRPRQAAGHRTWGNDDVIAANSANHESVVPIIPNDEDDELYQDLTKMKDSVVEDEEIDNTDFIVNGEGAETKDVALNEQVSDLDYLKSKMQPNIPKEPEIAETVKVHPGRMALLQESGAIDAGNVVNEYVAPEVAELEESATIVIADVTPFDPAPSPETIAETGRIMIRNLAYTCTYEDLEEYFTIFGPITEIHMPIDKITKQCKGYAFVLYMIPENALVAFTEMHNSIFQGRILEVVAAKEKPKSSDELQIPNTFKGKREQQKKASASSDINWNSLFMNSDAVAEAIARKLGVQKNEILDAQSDDMAVRLALAETTIINETKEYLEDEGVSLDAFGKKIKERSTTVILVKNIPSSTEETDLTELFGNFGTIGRLILPPARTIALVEFPDRNEAKVAFRKLAYKKFKNVPLYLEWAPLNTFTEEYNKEKIEKRKLERKEKVEDQSVKKIAEKPDVEELPPAATIFVKNLNFSTTEEGLKKAFENVGGLRSVRISSKPNVKVPGTKLSMGFGFLEFNNTEDAMSCIKSMQKFNLDGHELQLKFSNIVNKPSSNRKRTAQELRDDCSKLLVKNLPFQATKNDLKSLFSSFGALKTVRIPRKFDGTHRGFGFVDFLTPQEAQNAFQSLGATHLYGRHLVLEWAKDEDDIEEMRTKTAKSFVRDSKRLKDDDEMDDTDF